MHILVLVLENLIASIFNTVKGNCGAPHFWHSYFLTISPRLFTQKNMTDSISTAYRSYLVLLINNVLIIVNVKLILFLIHLGN